MASEVNFDLRIGLGDSNLYVPMLLYRSGSRADKMSSKYLPLPAASLGLCQSLCETSGSLRSPLVKMRGGKCPLWLMYDMGVGSLATHICMLTIAIGHLLSPYLRMSQKSCLPGRITFACFQLKKTGQKAICNILLSRFTQPQPRKRSVPQ